MSYKPVPLPPVEDPEATVYNYPPFNGGLNIADYPHKVQPNQSPDQLNMWYRDHILAKRPGQINISVTLGSEIIQCYRKEYKGFQIFHCSSKLYKLNMSTGATTQIHTGLSTVKGTFFVKADILYYLGGGKLTQWDGTTAANVVPYIPTVIEIRAPSGGGVAKDGYNRIGAGFKNAFSGTVADTVYYLTQSGLDATEVVCVVNGVTLVEGVGFTVNRTTGAVTFAIAPGEGVNNVLITAYKTDTALVNSILKCTFAEFFGAADNYLFVDGNPDFANYYFYSELFAVSGAVNYFPDSNYNIVGSSDNAMSGFGKHRGALIILQNTSCSRVTYDATATNKFPIEEVNSSIGCDMPWTVQVISNNLVFANTYMGVCLLASTLLGDKRNIRQISRNINGVGARQGLLNFANLTTASSYDYYGHYFICVGSIVYAWNYWDSPYIDTENLNEDQIRLEWFKWDNVNASVWFDYNKILYHGSRTGLFVKFADVLHDNGVKINGYNSTMLNDLGVAYWIKYIVQMWISLIVTGSTSVTVKYVTDEGEVYQEDSNYILDANSANIDSIDIDNGTLDVATTPITINKLPKQNSVYFQVYFINDVLYEDLRLSDLTLQFNKTRTVTR